MLESIPDLRDLSLLRKAALPKSTLGVGGRAGSALGDGGPVHLSVGLQVFSVRGARGNTSLLTFV